MEEAPSSILGIPLFFAFLGYVCLHFFIYFLSRERETPVRRSSVHPFRDDSASFVDARRRSASRWESTRRPFLAFAFGVVVVGVAYRPSVDGNVSCVRLIDSSIHNERVVDVKHHASRATRVDRGDG